MTAAVWACSISHKDFRRPFIWQSGRKEKETIFILPRALSKGMATTLGRRWIWIDNYNAGIHQAKSYRRFTFFFLFAFIYLFIYLLYFLFPSAAITGIMTTIILFADGKAATFKPHAL